MRILAVDYGERRTGVAVSDELGITAQGLDTVVVDDPARLPGEIARIVTETGATRILLGLPLNMNGTESDKSTLVRAFAAELRELVDIPVVFWDERLSTVQAQRVMVELGQSTRGRKHVVDRIAATLMLQEYLKTVP